MAKQLGIDLGTSNTKIYLKDNGIKLKAPSAVSVKRQTREVIAVGSEAKKMLGKTPEGIESYTPIKNGVIADFEIAVAMLEYYFKKINAISFFNRPSAIVGIPYGITEVERRAVEDATFDAGAKYVALVEEPLAAAIGAGLRATDPRGCMIVDIGGGTTEVAVISLGGIVASKTTRYAGDAFDNAIINYIKYEKNLLIGGATAEQIKLRVGSAHRKINVGELEISGRNIKTGLAATATISSANVREALEDQIDHLVRTVKATLEETPPELSADIFDLGIMLSGGGAKLPGIDRVLSERLGVRVTVAKKPMESVCLGIGKFVDGGGSYRGIDLKFRAR